MDSEQMMPAMRTSAAQASKFATAAHGTLIVRNTFIDEAVRRPASLDEFFKERMVHSCPASRQQSALTERLQETIFEDVLQEIMTDGSEGAKDAEADAIDFAGLTQNAEAVPSGSGLLSKLRTNGTEVLEKLQQTSILLHSDGLQGGVSSGFDWDWFSFASDAQAWSLPWPEMHRQGTEIALDSLLHPEGDYAYDCNQSPPPAPWAPPPPMQFDAPVKPPPEFAPPPPALPSVGSALHATGGCKPCWFIHKRGCSNGEQCTLCHLCPPGEWKRRRQQRRCELERAALAAQSAGVDLADSTPADEGNIMGLLEQAFSRHS
jgi:hypothetical protein